MPGSPPCPIAELRLCERGLERVHRLPDVIVQEYATAAGAAVELREIESRLLLHERGIICPRAAGRIPRRGSDTVVCCCPRSDRLRREFPPWIRPVPTGIAFVAAAQPTRGARRQVTRVVPATRGLRIVLTGPPDNRMLTRRRCAAVHDGDAHAHRLALTWRIGCDRKRTHREVGSSRTRNRDGVTRGVVVFTAFAHQAERIDDGTETILARWSVRRDDRSGGVGRLLARTERSRPAYAPAAQKCSAAKLR